MTLAGAPPLLIAGIGDMVLSADPGRTLVAYGLGSCVALAAWDPRTKAAGLAHFMLPSGPPSQDGPVKFIDGGVGPFLDAFRALGGLPSRSFLRAAGGASMLTIGAGGLEIGRRNSERLVGALSDRGLMLKATSFGGSAGRTVQLDVGSGRLLVKSLSTVTEL